VGTIRHLDRGQAVRVLVLVGTLAFAGYVADRVVRVPYAWMIGVFFVGAIVAHDFVLFPFYALADRLARRLALRPGPRPAVPWINHVRVPAVLSGLLLVMFFPLVLGLGEHTYRSATGLDTGPFLGRWLLVTGILFAGSGLIYLGRLWRAGR
jgi:hypothetical protein